MKSTLNLDIRKGQETGNHYIIAVSLFQVKVLFHILVRYYYSGKNNVRYSVQELTRNRKSYVLQSNNHSLAPNTDLF